MLEGAQPAALWRPRGWDCREEAGSRGGMSMWDISIIMTGLCAVRQKSTQHCRAIMLQLKKREREMLVSWPFSKEKGKSGKRSGYCPLLEKEMATHSRVLAWRIPGTGEPGGLPSLGSHRVGHDWSDLAAATLKQRFDKTVPQLHLFTFLHFLIVQFFHAS